MNRMTESLLHAPEEVTYLKHSAGSYTVFAKDGGHLLGDVVCDGLYWWAGSHRYPTRRAAAEMLLDRHLAHRSPAREGRT